MSFKTPRRSIRSRLYWLFVLLLLTFAVMLTLLFNSLLQHQLISGYNKSMQRDAYAISQNLSELIAPSGLDTLDETRFIVSKDTLAPYLALIEQITSCNVYIIDSAHNVTGYFDGVVQRLENPLLPGYIEETIALGFLGKTPSMQAEYGNDTHLAACMPIMDENNRVLGVILLEASLRSLGFSQVPSALILLVSIAVAFPLSGVLALIFTRWFTKPIKRVQRFALQLAGGNYSLRMEPQSEDEIGSLALSMDVLAGRLEETRDLNARLHKQQQAFFADVSHELKTPVTIIRGSLEALHDGVISDQADVQAYYRQMIAESRWLQRLIQDLLELSRLKNLEFSLEQAELSLTDLLCDVAMSARPLCSSKGIRFDCEEPRREFLFVGDYSRLRQMLIAVIDNAVKYTPEGRGIHLSLHPERPEITIADEGIGIPAADLEHIFDRFHHSPNANRQNTGLGLTIVKAIAVRHEIDVRVTSRENEGTAFTFTFTHARPATDAP